MNFSKQELDLISDKSIIELKLKATDKVIQLFEGLKSQIKAILKERNFSEIPSVGGKISRGENYLQLPYVNLDYPAHFSKKDVFAFRWFFWWGNFFSFTFHLSGTYLGKHREALIASHQTLANHGLFICVGNTPWQYHYEPDNYMPLQDVPSTIYMENDFIKISQKYGINEADDYLNACIDFLALISSIINVKPEK